MRIIDDFLDSTNFNRLQEFILGMDFPWFYIPTVSMPPGILNFSGPAQETWGFNHIVYDSIENLESFVFSSMPLILTTFEEKFNVKIKKLLRIRMGMKHPKIGFTKDHYNLPHVDYFFPHATLIYYINNSDGNTRIFNEIYQPKLQEPDSFTIDKEVAPVANRMLFLENGLTYHTAANPIDSDRRVVVNVNLIL